MAKLATKTCPHCKVEKTTADFSKDKHRKDGLANWCRTCMSAYWSAKRAAANAGKPATPKAPRSPGPSVAALTAQVEATPARELETDDGQKLLDDAAKAAKRARADAYNQQRREARAAAKLAAESI